MYSSSGTLIGTFDIGAGVADFSADGKTMWYLRGLDLYKLDIASQISTDLGSLPSSNSADLRIMRDGNILIADGDFQFSGGVAVSIVSPSGGPALRSYYIPAPSRHINRVAFDPDGTSFWALDPLSPPTVFKVDIASGKVLASFGVGTAPPWRYGFAVL